MKIEEKEQKFGISVKKEDDFSEWYCQVVIKSELIDYYMIKGCYTMRPLSMFIWNQIKNFFSAEIEKLNVQDCYFPMLVTKSALEQEKDHINNFAPELAWITMCGDTQLDVPVAIRPTSESIMYPCFSKWLRSHRDLPLKLNQWCNVLRWEVKSTTPFIRAREFLWQEGHTAFYTQEEADKEVLHILDLYARIYTDLLAVPVIKGIKSENEKFGGAAYTTTVEAFIPGSGRGIQAATSHSLGTNFSKMYDIKVSGDNDVLGDSFVFQNSWGITTRTIGIATMIHSDNKGLVLPPRVAMYQVVIVPCGITAGKDTNLLFTYIQNIADKLKNAGIRVFLDKKENVTPGYKFNYWELRGVPIRMEIGFKDMSKNSVTIVKRYNYEKKIMEIKNIEESILDELNLIHSDMFLKAKQVRDSRISRVKTYDKFVEAIDKKNLALVPWCGSMECEESVKNKGNAEDSSLQLGVKSMCIPHENEKCSDVLCFNCEKMAVSYALFGRSY